MPPLRGSNAPRLCDRPTDRPTDRVDVIIINHLPNALRENQTHPGTGGFFRSLRAHRAGLPPLPPSLPPKSMGRRLTPPAWSPGRLSGGGRGARETAQHERAKRESSARAAGSRPTGLLEIFAKLKEEKYLKIQRQIRLPRPSAATPKTASLCALRCIFGCIFPCIVS